MNQNTIPLPKIDQVMIELEKFDEQQAKEQIAKILWESGNPKLALWFVMHEQIPY